MWVDYSDSDTDLALLVEDTKRMLVETDCILRKVALALTPLEAVTLTNQLARNGESTHWRIVEGVWTVC